MIQINKAVLHIFDFPHDSLVLSQAQMPIADLNELHFVGKQIEKLLHSPTTKKGTFTLYSKIPELIKQYKSEELSILDVSINIAKTWYQLIKESDKIEASSMLACDIYDNANHMLVIIKYKNKNGYQHSSGMEEGRVINTVVENASILPNASQSIEECMLIHLDTLDIYFKDIKRIVQGSDCYLIPERILHANSELSCKEVIQTIGKIGMEFCELYELDPIEITSKTKEYMQGQLADDGYLHSEELSTFVFKNEAMASEFLLETKKAQVPELMRLHEQFTNSSSKNQKLKADNGIEIILPAGFYHDKTYFEMIPNEDQTMNIVLKNITSIK